MNSYTEAKWLSYRNNIIDFLNLRKNKNHIHGMFEIDITKVSKIISERKINENRSNAKIAYLLWCYGQAIRRHPEIQGIKNGKKIILFNDVDIAMTFEIPILEMIKVPVIYIFRSVQHKTYKEIIDELVSLKNKDLFKLNKTMNNSFFRALPGSLRVFIRKTLLRDHIRFKNELGTVAYTSLGQTLRNRKFWPIPIGPYPCLIASGSTYIRSDPDGEKIIWCITISVDHNIIDGAPAVRFSQTFINLLESAEGLN